MQREHLDIVQRSHDIVHAAAPRITADASSLALGKTPRSDLLWSSHGDLLQLQGRIGNRAISRMAADVRTPLQRAPKVNESQRPMVEGPEKGKTDEPQIGPEGDSYVWDAFDRTLTLFTAPGGPHGGKAFRVTYKEGTAEEIEQLAPGERYTNVEALSAIRAKALEWLRTKQGTYQETEEGRANRVANSAAAYAAATQKWVTQSPANQAAFTEYQTRMQEYNQGVQDWKDGKRKVLPAVPKVPSGMPVEAKVTACNLHTGQFAEALAGRKAHMGDMDPRLGAILEGRGGAFHTLESHPAGPKAGDIVSYGAIYKPQPPGTLRRGDFNTIKHIGVFKSRRPGPNGSEIWTVVDGGQGEFLKRQETRERTRLFQRERLAVSIPKVGKSGTIIGKEKDAEEMECGVLKSKLADAGQSDDDKLLRGWVDIDEFFGTGPAPEATAQGANNPVFTGKPTPAPATAAVSP
jgi:hypothetical protein